jgi:hypothetical protein
MPRADHHRTVLHDPDSVPSTQDRWPQSRLPGPATKGPGAPSSRAPARAVQAAQRPSFAAASYTCISTESGQGMRDLPRQVVTASERTCWRAGGLLVSSPRAQWSPQRRGGSSSPNSRSGSMPPRCSLMNSSAWESSTLSSRKCRSAELICARSDSRATVLSRPRPTSRSQIPRIIAGAN